MLVHSTRFSRRSFSITRVGESARFRGRTEKNDLRADQAESGP